MKFNIEENIDGVIIGSLLGDGSITSSGIAINLSHTEPQKNYFSFKVSLFKQAGYRTSLYRPSSKNTTFGIFTYYSARIFLDNRRWLTASLDDLLDNLNPLGLLIWWLDDGCLNVHAKKSGSVSRFGYLNTQSFGYEDQLKIQRALKERFGIFTRIHIDTKSGVAKKDHLRIYLNATNLRRLIDLVREFIGWIPKDMLYKFNMKYVLNRNPMSPELTKHYNF